MLRAVQQYGSARLLASIACTVLLVLGLCGCQTAGQSDITGSLGESPKTGSSAVPADNLAAYRDRFRGNPKDADAALQYGKALRTARQRAQAVAVLEQATIIHPDHKALLAGYGRALLDNGNFQQAFDVLSRAHNPDDPDWRILSAQGTALDQLGRFEEARQYYTSALRISPDEPSLQSNLGLSYVLSKDLLKAEEILRRANSNANADLRVRQNLALVIGLQGRLPEAETVAKAGRTPEQSKGDVSYLRRWLARKEGTGKDVKPD